MNNEERSNNSFYIRLLYSGYSPAVVPNAIERVTSDVFKCPVSLAQRISVRRQPLDAMPISTAVTRIMTL